MYYDELIENADDLSFNSDNKNKINNLLGDKRLFTVRRRNYEGKIKKIQIFASGQMGNTIRNAVSGFKYTGNIVGSKGEDQFFRVGIATGELGRDGVTLFYENPEQFENHMYEEVSQEIKEIWNQKSLISRYNSKK